MIVSLTVQIVKMWMWYIVYTGTAHSLLVLPCGKAKGTGVSQFSFNWMWIRVFEHFQIRMCSALPLHFTAPWISIVQFHAYFIFRNYHALNVLIHWDQSGLCKQEDALCEHFPVDNDSQKLRHRHCHRHSDLSARSYSFSIRYHPLSVVNSSHQMCLFNI